ncbi:MAG: transposase [Bacteroidetes bacterium]|nr:transposase [Bacteroidota bacterium]
MKPVFQHNRKSIRLKDYDYSHAGEYFITICTYDRECIFGDVIRGEMRLSQLGEVVRDTWYDLPNHNRGIELDAFVVMPNHIHGIIIINDITVGAGLEPAPTGKRHGLTEIIRQLKTFSALCINKKRNTVGYPVWQRNYYERIIRNDRELNIFRDYIENNVIQWFFDTENAQNI